MPRGGRRPDDSRDEDAFDGADDAPWSDAEEIDEHEARDRERFSADTAFCPECGAEIWDAADVCPKCFTWIDGETVGRRASRVGRRRMQRVVVWLLIVAMLSGAGLLGVLGWF